MVKKYHPDTNKDGGAKERFLEIQQAYEILSDPQKKATYDATGSTEAAESDFEGQGQTSADFDPSEILRTMFGGAAGRGSPFADFFGTETDLNVSLDLPISFMDSVLGTAKQVTYSVLEPCDPCLGTGVTGGAKLRVCPTCRGSGQVSLVDKFVPPSDYFNLCPNHARILVSGLPCAHSIMLPTCQVFVGMIVA